MSAVCCGGGGGGGACCCGVGLSGRTCNGWCSCLKMSIDSCGKSGGVAKSSCSASCCCSRLCCSKSLCRIGSPPCGACSYWSLFKMSRIVGSICAGCRLATSLAALRNAKSCSVYCSSVMCNKERTVVVGVCSVYLLAL